MAEKTWMAEATTDRGGKPVTIWHRVPGAAADGKARGDCGTVFRPAGSKSGLAAALAAPKCIVCARA